MALRLISHNLLQRVNYLLPLRMSPAMFRFQGIPNANKFHTGKPMAKLEDITVTFIQQDGTKIEGKGKEGDNLLDIIVDNDIDIDGFGACEGTLACSTCHVIFSQEDFDRLEEEATDEELDMLDLAYGLTDTSRLGCQVCISKKLSGINVQIPEGVNDQR